MKNKRFIIILSIIPIVLLIPLIGMQFSNEVNWSLFDFILLFGLLCVTGLAIEFTCRIVRSNLARTLLCLAILLILALVWMELAVGIFGTPFAGS